MTNKEAIEVLEKRIKTSESLGEHIEPNIYDNNGYGDFYGDFAYKHYQASCIALEALKTLEITKKKQNNTKPDCFISNKNPYPLCKGSNTLQEIAENQCITCALFEDYDDSAGY